ncbi:MAG: hypothetical protein ABSC93_30565, partial [Bryobacteraceae bacterium]
NRKQLSIENGNIEVELAPNAMQASAAGEADFPSVASGPQGRVALAWQEFTGERDRVVSREWDGTLWKAAEVLDAAQTHDVFRPSAGYDGTGTLHVVWSAQVDGNWDLYERRKAGDTWSALERLTTAAGSDFSQRVATDNEGNLWLAWQAFRNGQSDIYVKVFHDGTWRPEIRVSESAANDWDPALAADANGKVRVAWDSYERGNYDVFVRLFTKGQPGPIRAVTHSPRLEAHAALACDKEGRLWIAFDEAGANWGKDYGYLVKTAGNPLYQSRKVRVVRISADRIEEPAAPLSDAFPLYLPRFLQNRAGWHGSQTLPVSAGANDSRVALAAGPDGSLWAAWAADNRDFQTARPRQQAVYAASVPQEAGAGEIKFKDFVEWPERSAPVRPNEAGDLRAIRDYRMHLGGREYRILRGDLRVEQEDGNLAWSSPVWIQRR